MMMMHLVINACYLHFVAVATIQKDVIWRLQTVEYRMMTVWLMNFQNYL